MTAKCRSRVAVAWLAIGVVVGCARQITLPADLETVAHPDLGASEEIARRQLEKQRDSLEARLVKGGDRLELAGAFGGMGELYHAYELLPAGAACYRNAERLDPESFLWPYYLGALHQAAGDLSAAAESLEKALSLVGDDRPAHRRLGEVRLALGDPAEARRHFEALLGDERFAAAAHFGLGQAAAAAGDAGEATAHFAKTLELEPGAGIVHHALGLALRQLDRLDEARVHLETKGSGEVTSPDRLMERLETLAVSSGAYLRRGNHALMSGRLDEAAEALRHAVEADPTSSSAQRNLALVLARQGDFQGAILVLEAAARQDAGDVWLHLDLGNAYLRRGRGDEAVGELRRATELAPNLVVAHFNLANALMSLERWDEARPHLETVLELDPGNRRARYLAAMAEHHDGANAAAASALRPLLAEDPADTVARRGLATVLADDGQAAKAMEVYRQGIELDLPLEERVELSRLLASLAWKHGDRRQAIAEWRRVTALTPSSSQAFTDLANSLQLAGDRDEARRHFARAVELDPQNATARLSEASLWILGGQFATARQRLEEALVAAPDHPGLNHTLARLLATAPEPSTRDGRQALALARKAYGLEGSLDHAETVGMALAELGQFEEAIRWQRGLINQASRTGDRAVLQRLVTNLRLYERRQPIRAAP